MPRKIRLRDLGVDPNNISGKTLAEIGKWALTGEKILEEATDAEKMERTSIDWLDQRIKEVCDKGRL